MKTKKFRAEGMTCGSCEKIIEGQAKSIEGVESIKIDYATQEGEITYDSDKIDINDIFKKIEEKGYVCCLSDGKKKRFSFKAVSLLLGLIVILFGGYLLVQNFGLFTLPDIGQKSSLILLFIVGLLTGFHCIGMCGGFVMSYTSKKAIENKKSLHVGSHIQYGLGKVVSYTVIGAFFGLIGSIFIFTPMMRGVVAIAAGAFLLIFGLNMLNLFPFLRKIRIPTPKFVSKFSANQKTKSPLVIGLMNGLFIACGPLQAFYIYAAGTGSVSQGALVLFAFGLGTLPVLLGFGIFASYVSKSMTHKILKISAIIVILLGIVMLNRGLALTGTGYDLNSMVISVSATGDAITGDTINVVDGYQVIEMEVNRYGWDPDKFVLKKGVPVKWIINGKEITGCNNAIQSPKLGLNFDVKQGEQIIEFTPEEEGIIPFNCWMGMIPGVFVVKEDINLNNQEEIQKELDNVPKQPVASCGGSCGSSTCGGGTPRGCGCGGR